jgi:hypothetical protein
METEAVQKAVFWPSDALDVSVFKGGNRSVSLLPPEKGTRRPAEDSVISAYFI